MSQVGVGTFATLSLLICAFAGYAQAPADTRSNVPEGKKLLRIVPIQDPSKPISELLGTANATASNPHLTYYGGPVISNVNVVVVFWGTGVDATVANGIYGFYNTVLDSTYLDMLYEYSTVSTSFGGTTSNQSIGHGSVSGPITITPSSGNAGAKIDDSAIQTELQAQIASGHLPGPTLDSQGNSNTLYAVYFPAGKTITLGTSTSCVDFCAYHGGAPVRNASSNPIFQYSVIPDFGASSGCHTGCGGSTEFNNVTSVSSHELAESITDAQVSFANVYGPPLGWYDIVNGEAADICNANQSSITANGSTYTVQKIWSNQQGYCTASPGASFAVSTSPSAPVQSQPVAVTVTVKNYGGQVLPFYTGTVSLSSSDTSATLPASYRFTDADAGKHTFSVTFAKTGSQSIIVSDSAGGISGGATVTVSAATGPSSQTITFNPIANQTQGSTLTLVASASSGLPVSFASLTSSVCTVSGTSANLVGVGTCTIQASQPGNGSYLAAAPVSQSFSVSASTTAAPNVSYVAFWGITSSGVTISWSTDIPANTQVAYGTTPALGQMSPLQSNLTSSHGVVLTGLNSGTTYYFVAESGANGVTGYSTTYSFTTGGSAASAAPVISGISASSITNTSAVITWTTDQATTSQVNYGTSTGYGLSTSPQTTLTTSHAITLTGLTAGTIYNFDVVSANSAGVASTSGNNTFSTTSSSAIPPNLGYLAYWSVTNSGVTISWSTDVAASTQVNYGTTAALGTQTPLQTALTNNHGVVLTGLNSGTTYYFVAESTGANGATGYSTTYSFTTGGTSSGTPAPIISNVSYSAVTSTSAVINWSTDQPASSQVNYGTTTSYGSSTPVVSTLSTSHSVTLSGLTPGTTYEFDVVSANSGGTSATSTNYSFVTSSSSGTPIITNVAATAISGTSVIIVWTTDQPTTSLVNYGTTAGYGSSSTQNTTLTTSHSVTLSGLSPGTTYDFDVVSANSSNISATSANSTFTTSASTATPPYVGYVAYWGISSYGITVSWSTDVPANTVLAYGTTPALGLTSPVQSALTSSHGVVLTGLNSGTTYYFVAQSTGANGATGSSAIYSFTTSQ